LVQFPSEQSPLFLHEQPIGELPWFAPFGAQQALPVEQMSEAQSLLPEQVQPGSETPASFPVLPQVGPLPLWPTQPSAAQHTLAEEQAPETQSVSAAQEQPVGESLRFPPGRPQQSEAAQLFDRQSASPEQPQPGAEAAPPLPAASQFGPGMLPGTVPPSIQKVGAGPHTWPASLKPSTQPPVQQGNSTEQALPVAMQAGSVPVGPGPESTAVVVPLQPKAATAAARIEVVVQLTRMRGPSSGRVR
jgi:hypothetical protein